jgi:hypothetical protein
MLHIDDDICISSPMEDVGAVTTDAEKATEEQQIDESDFEQAVQQHKGSKLRRTIPQKLKTSERRRIQNRAAQKTYR